MLLCGVALQKQLLKKPQAYTAKGGDVKKYYLLRIKEYGFLVKISF